MSNFTPTQVQHVANLANIPVSEKEKKQLSKDFSETLGVINNLLTMDTKKVEPTHHTTGLQNILREDEVNKKTMFTQKQALANGAQIHNGYFVVKQVISK